MRKLFVLAALFALAVACSNETAESKSDSASSCKKSLNPNGDSELALLMRKLANWNDSTKALFVKDSVLTSAQLTPPSDYNTIFTAKKTDPSIDQELFTSLARHYASQVEQFRTSPSDRATQVKNFNSMVNACVSCHENFCGGPLKRINKMFVKE